MDPNTLHIYQGNLPMKCIKKLYDCVCPFVATREYLGEIPRVIQMLYPYDR